MKTTPKQEQFITCYLQNNNAKLSAKMVNVSYSTVNKWLDNGLKKEIFSRQKALTRSSLLILQTSIYKATQTLNDILQDKTAPPTTKLKASEIILSHAIPSIEITEITDRLERLENTIN